MYVNAGFNSQRLRVIGYPFTLSSHVGKQNEQLRVCLLGQSFEVYDNVLGRKKKQVFQKFADSLRKAGIETVNKTYSVEKQEEFLSNGVKIVHAPMIQSLGKYDAFLSVVSTALLEATLAGKVAIQIFDPCFRAESFVDAGYSFSIEARDVDRIARNLAKNRNAFPVPQDVVFTQSSLHDRFLRVLNSIDSHAAPSPLS
jgi:hypothetical protein